MAVWTDRVLPGIVDRILDRPEINELRRAACEGLGGQVVELGFGSGPNLSHYPWSVTEVVAVEPNARAWALGERRRREARMPVLRGALDGQSLDQPDESVDGVLSTFTLCTIPDAARALAEVRRILRPGGSLHFLEHGLAPDASTAAWQRRLEPIQRRVGGGCHLTRPIGKLVESAGFRIRRLDEQYLPGPAVNRPFTRISLGVADLA